MQACGRLLPLQRSSFAASVVSNRLRINGAHEPGDDWCLLQASLRLPPAFRSFCAVMLLCWALCTASVFGKPGMNSV